MNEFQVREALRGMRNQLEVPALDPAKERALLAAFDARQARPARAVAGRWVWAAATAASVAIAAALNFVVATNVRDRAQALRGTDALSQGANVTPVTADDSGGFVPWPGASTLPSLRRDLHGVIQPMPGLLPLHNSGAPGARLGNHSAQRGQLKD